jgi:tRNA (guanosine-2'-O-)-methyltransferase
MGEINIRPLSDTRRKKFERVIAKRQGNLTLILENVHDSHNIGAVLRTSDSVGIREVFIVYTDPALAKDRLKLGKRTTAGARKWIEVHYFTDLDACMKAVRDSYEFIWATMMDEQARDLFELDLTQSVALLFGNERDGVSEEALRHADGNFIIPQVGMVESLNISVACAVTLYEAYRQRTAKGLYDQNTTMSEADRQALTNEYYRRHATQFNNQSVEKKNP